MNVEKKRRLEDAYTTSTAGPAYDEIAKRAEYTAMGNKELINMIRFNLWSMPKDKNKAGYVNTIIENEMKTAGALPPNLRLRKEIDQTDADIQQIVSDIKKKMVK